MSQMPMTQVRMTELSSLEKGLRILRELASSERGMTAAELAQFAGLNRTTVYRLSEILAREGWVQRLGDDDETPRLDLGPAMHGLAVLVTNKYDTDTQLQPIIRGLARSLNETVHVGALDHNHVVHIAVAMPESGLNIAARIGSREFAHVAALGKALLATLPDEEVRGRYVGNTLTARTATSIATVDELLEELERTRERGYAIDAEEAREGVYCIAVPVLGPGRKALFAISVTTVPQRLEGREGQLVEAVQAAANLATSSFGGHDTNGASVPYADRQGAANPYRSRIAVPR
jgi:IclR family transcriptional regulator, acetate operon repressor